MVGGWFRGAGGISGGGARSGWGHHGRTSKELTGVHHGRMREGARGGGEGGNNPLSRSRIRLLISGQGTGIHSVKSALMSRKNTKLLWVKVLLLILPRRITYMLSSLTVLRSVTLVQHALARRCVSSIEALNM